MVDESPPRQRLKQVRVLLWVVAALAIAGTVALLLMPRTQTEVTQTTTQGSFGGPFTLVGADGKPFSSQTLANKPYAMYFGFTRCADECPTTLSRLVRLRRAAANDNAMRIVFVTIDPAHDGPKEVGQYATLFNAPIIGLTGSQAQIDQVKKQYGIFAQPVEHAAAGEEIVHSTAVLLFRPDGGLAGTITPDETDDSAVAKIKKLIA
jgi:protein SCO1/2